MLLANNATLNAGSTTRYLINIPSVEKRFNLSLYWGNNAGAGTTARIMFSDIWDDRNPDQTLVLNNARGITKPELVLDLNTATDREFMWFVFPIYARKAWLEIEVAGTNLTGVTAYVQPISNTER